VGSLHGGMHADPRSSALQQAGPYSTAVAMSLSGCPPNGPSSPPAHPKTLPLPNPWQSPATGRTLSLALAGTTSMGERRATAPLVTREPWAGQPSGHLGGHGSRLLTPRHNSTRISIADSAKQLWEKSHLPSGHRQSQGAAMLRGWPRDAVHKRQSTIQGSASYTVVTHPGSLAATRMPVAGGMLPSSMVLPSVTPLQRPQLTNLGHIELPDAPTMNGVTGPSYQEHWFKNVEAPVASSRHDTHSHTLQRNIQATTKPWSSALEPGVGRAEPGGRRDPGDRLGLPVVPQVRS